MSRKCRALSGRARSPLASRLQPTEASRRRALRRRRRRRPRRRAPTAQASSCERSLHLRARSTGRCVSLKWAERTRRGALTSGTLRDEASLLELARSRPAHTRTDPNVGESRAASIPVFGQTRSICSAPRARARRDHWRARTRPLITGRRRQWRGRERKKFKTTPAEAIFAPGEMRAVRFAQRALRSVVNRRRGVSRPGDLNESGAASAAEASGCSAPSARSRRARRLRTPRARCFTSKKV